MTPRVITDAAALEALAPAWWALWRRVPDATPFVSPAWLLPWWAVFAPGDLRVAAVMAGDRLAALALLYRETGSHGRRLLPLGIGLSDAWDVLVDPEAPEAAALLLPALAAHCADWDVLSAEDLPPRAAGLTLPAPPGWREATAPQSACPLLEFPAGPGAVEAAVPAAQRRKWRMAAHRAARRRGRLALAGDGDLDHALDDLFRLHGARWEARGAAGVLADGRVQSFHRQAAPASRPRGFSVSASFTWTMRWQASFTAFTTAPPRPLTSAASTPLSPSRARARCSWGRHWTALWGKGRVASTSPRPGRLQVSLGRGGPLDQSPHAGAGVVTEALGAALREAAEGDAPPQVALMRVLMEAPDAALARQALDAALAARARAGEATALGRLRAVDALWRTHPGAWDAVRGTIDGLDHARPAGNPDDSLRYWQESFDSWSPAGRKPASRSTAWAMRRCWPRPPPRSWRSWTAGASWARASMCWTSAAASAA